MTHHTQRILNADEELSKRMKKAHAERKAAAMRPHAQAGPPFVASLARMIGNVIPKRHRA